MASENTTHITISTATVMKLILIALGLWAVYAIADILLLFVASILLAAALDPYVDGLEKHGIPRSVSMIGIYLILFGVLSVALILMIPPLVEQIGSIAHNFPAVYSQITGWLTTPDPTSAQTSSGIPLPDAVSAATQGLFSFVTGVFGGIISFLTVIILTFYLVVDKGAIARTVSIAPKQHQAYLTGLYERLQVQIGIWLRAQLILMAIVGLLTYVLLSALRLFGFDVPYALTLSLFAGLTEFIPYIGPIIGSIPAIFIGYSVSPTLALIVAIVYYGIQTIENSILVPKIMERALGLSPIISIIVFLVGAELAGITGAFLSIPIATAGMVIAKDIMSRRNGVSTT